MSFKLNNNKKYAIAKRYVNGESVHSVCSELQIPRSNFTLGLKAINLRNFRILESKVKRLEGIIEILKMADCTASAPLKERLNALEWLYGKYSVHIAL